VNVVLTTNVDAEIVDVISGAVLGQTNQPSGFTLDRNDTPREVLLRAEGYQDLAFGPNRSCVTARTSTAKHA
jgi:hypothetical protein